MHNDMNKPYKNEIWRELSPIFKDDLNIEKGYSFNEDYMTKNHKTQRTYNE